MEIVTKCMFLGKKQALSKKGTEYKMLKFLDKSTNDVIDVYVNDFGKYGDCKPFSDIDVKFNLFRDSKGLLRIGLVE